MPDTPKLTILKEFSYRGVAEEWSNTYHFSGSTPTNATEWRTLFDAWVLAEKTLLPAGVSYNGGYGYEAGSASADWVFDYVAAGLTRPVGTNPFTGTTPGPGDSAWWIRWSTALSPTSGKMVYLRKYFHPAPLTTSGGDAIYSGSRTLGATYGAKLIDGTLPGSARICGPQGAVASAPYVCLYATTRTLKKRSKRPPS